MAEALRANTSMLSLKLAHNKIKDKGLAYLAAALPLHRSLSELLLTSCAIGDAGAIALAQALTPAADSSGSAGIHQFPSLDLGGNRVGDEGAAALAALCRLNPSITCLDLKANLLGDVGAAALAEALLALSGLSVVDVSGNQLSSRGAVALSVAVKALPATRSLSLDLSDNGECACVCLLHV